MRSNIIIIIFWSVDHNHHHILIFRSDHHHTLIFRLENIINILWSFDQKHHQHTLIFRLETSSSYSNISIRNIIIIVCHHHTLIFRSVRHHHTLIFRSVRHHTLIFWSVLHHHHTLIFQLVWHHHHQQQPAIHNSKTKSLWITFGLKFQGWYNPTTFSTTEVTVLITGESVPITLGLSPRTMQSYHILEDRSHRIDYGRISPYHFRTMSKDDAILPHSRQPKSPDWLRENQSLSL